MPDTYPGASGDRIADNIAPIVDAILDSCEGASSASNEARDVSAGISRTVDRLREAVDATVGAMDEIRQGADATTAETVHTLATVRDDVASGVEQIAALDEAVDAMDRFVAVIRGVADQTNLLSLNARIEAARAGDAGRGFAVVAAEVRKLAEHSSREASSVREAITAVREAAQARRAQSASRPSASTHSRARCTACARQPVPAGTMP